MTSFVHSPADLAVIKTADDALVAKIACIERKYYQDDFLAAFESDSGRQRFVQPLIKRGTYGRVCCMDKVIALFANHTEEEDPLQVVVMGSGKDTTFFRFVNQQLTTDVFNDCSSVAWFEVDHASVIEEKASQIQNNRQKFAAAVDRLDAANFRVTPDEEPSVSNTLIGHDLRQNPNSLFASLTSLGLNSAVPVLFIFECVLMYMPESSTSALLEAISALSPKATVACYEPILGSDPFGRIMETNLTSAGVTQPDHCLVKTRTIDNHLDKIRHGGFQSGIGCDMWVAYETLLRAEQRNKASRCEFLDELEEMILIMRHYCFIVAGTGNQGFFAELISSIGFDKAQSAAF